MSIKALIVRWKLNVSSLLHCGPPLKFFWYEMVSNEQPFDMQSLAYLTSVLSDPDWQVESLVEVGNIVYEALRFDIVIMAGNTVELNGTFSNVTGY